MYLLLGIFCLWLFLFLTECNITAGRFRPVNQTRILSALVVPEECGFLIIKENEEVSAMTYYYALSVVQPKPYRSKMTIEEIENTAVNNIYLTMYRNGGIATCAIISPEIQSIVGNSISVGAGDSLIEAVCSCLSQCIFAFRTSAVSDNADAVFRMRLATIESYYDIGILNENFTLQQFSKWNDISSEEASMVLLELIRGGIILPINTLS